MLQRISALLLAMILLPSPVGAGEPALHPDRGGFSVEARGAVVMEYESGRVLFAQGADRELPMASTTKILSALITLEEADRDSYFTVDSQAIHVEGSSMGLQEGDQVTLNNLAYGMLLPSGNDAANAAAVQIAGSVPDFLERMNERAAEIGMTRSSFATPSGLDAPGHYSTAYDMALLTREALHNPEFREICSSYKAVQEFGNPPYKRWMTNHNRLLRLYDDCIGVKTGFTDDARRCLVSAAKRGDVTLIVVTLNAADDFNTHIALYERYFSQLAPTDVSAALGDISIPVAGSGEQLAAVPAEPMQAALFAGEEKTLTRQVETDHFLYAPVAKGDVVGIVRLLSAGETVYESPLLAAQEMALPRRSGLLSGLWSRLTGLLD